MTELLRLASFLIFVALGVVVAAAGRSRRKRWAVNGLIAYVIALSLFVGVTQRDAWPFTNYMLAVGRPNVDTRRCSLELSGVDATGRAWRIDPYSWSPLFEWPLELWLKRHLDRLPADARERVFAFLSERAEQARSRLSASRPIGYDRLLGSTLSAPYWWILPRALDVAPHPYAALRVDQVCWIPTDIARPRAARERTTLVEYRRP